MADLIFNPDALRAARRRASMTQGQLAEAVTCSRNTVVRAEAGNCTRKMARQFAKVVGTDVATFYERRQAKGQGMQLSAQEKEVVSIMREAGDAVAWSVHRFARSLHRDRVGSAETSAQKPSAW